MDCKGKLGQEVKLLLLYKYAVQSVLLVTSTSH